MTLVTNATAAFSPEGMKVAHEMNGPTYAHAIVSSEEPIAAFAAAAAALTTANVGVPPAHPVT